MKLLKLAVLPAAVMATSAFAQDVVVVEQAPTAVTTTTYDANAGVIKNSTTQLVDGTRTVFGTLFHPAAISAEVGTLGYGANLGWALNDKTELQAGWAGGDVGNLKDTVKIGDVDYDLETDFSNPYLGVQMRPMGNWFTVGAGTIVGDNELHLKRQSSQSQPTEINGKIYDGSIEATVKNKNAMNPYLTLGFRPNLTNKFGVYGEVGAAYTGGLEVKDATYNTVINGVPVNNINFPALKSDLQADLDDSDYSKWFPIAKLGLTYRF